MYKSVLAPCRLIQLIIQLLIVNNLCMESLANIHYMFFFISGHRVPNHLCKLDSYGAQLGSFSSEFACLCSQLLFL